MAYSTLQLELRDNFKEVERQLGLFERQEVPFAVVRSLTEIAVESRDVLRSVERARFTLRSQWVQRGTQARSATKASMRSEVGSVDWFMAEHEGGAVRRPRSARHIAEPRLIRTNRKRRITPAKRPRQVLKKPNVYRAKTRRGNEAIYRRGKGRRPPTLLYLLHEQVRIKKRPWFEKPVIATTRRRLPKIFGRNLGRGIAQAKRRA